MLPVTFARAPGRIVAVGDLHGDMAQAQRALELAGVLGWSAQGRVEWVGGDTTLVQVGDILDRGSQELGIFSLLRQLAVGAQQAGGAVHILIGNHEVLNVSGDFRYVTRGAFAESRTVLERMMGPEAAAEALSGGQDGAAAGANPKKQEWEETLRARLMLFSPGGPVARELSQHSTILMVNDTVFAHGGLLPEHVEYGLENLNAAVSRWMRGEGDESVEAALQLAAGNSDSVVWNRQYAKEQFTEREREVSCALLARTLAAIPGAKRLVVGHTPQLSGCTCECNGQIWRVDVGMSSGVIGAPPSVLEIDGDSVRVLREDDDTAAARSASSLAAKL